MHRKLDRMSLFFDVVTTEKSQNKLQPHRENYFIRNKLDETRGENE